MKIFDFFLKRSDYFEERLQAEIDKRLESSLNKALFNNENLLIIYLIITLRGEFLYNMSADLYSVNKESVKDDPQYYIQQERKLLRMKCQELFKDKNNDQIDDMLNNFFKQL